jgi:two-component system, OmpR family, sensor kinase
MSSSIRSRLWWSYILVTFAALAIVTLILLIYIIQNPSTYRQASARLLEVAAILRQDEVNLSNPNLARLKGQLEKVGQEYDARIIIFSPRRQVLVDSQAELKSIVKIPALPRFRNFSVLRDQSGDPWLYIIQHLTNGRWLLVAVPRPAVPILTILSDELIFPVLVAAVAALLISLVLAFALSRWIGAPLQRLVAVSRSMPSPVTNVRTKGPKEVQELTRAFNDMNTRVLASQRSQRDFVANVSHELKTPLTSVQGFAQALLDGTAGSPAARRQAAQIIHDEAGRMHRMVLDLLDLARLDAGTLDFMHAPVDMPALLTNIAKKFTPQAQAAGVAIHVGAIPPVSVLGDGDRLAQVFTNLVDNALKNTPAGGRIDIRAAQVGSQLQVEVTDSGSGIDPQALSHIFERFYQVDPSRPGGEKHGAGLGLAIVQEIIQAHGGKIGVQSVWKPILSEDEGSGSTFTMTLPLATPDTSEISSKHKSKEA